MKITFALQLEVQKYKFAPIPTQNSFDYSPDAWCVIDLLIFIYFSDFQKLLLLFLRTCILFTTEL